MTLDMWNKCINVNLTGAFLCSKYAILNGCKRIINIGSTSSFYGRGGWSSYGVTKSALLSFTESLNDEGIKAQILCFGRTNTNLRKKLNIIEDISKNLDPIIIARAIFEIITNKYDSMLIFVDKLGNITEKSKIECINLEIQKLIK